MKPLFIRLSQVRMVLCPTSQRKVLIFGQSLESQILLQMGALGSVEKLAFRPYASLIVKVPLGVCPQLSISGPCLTLIRRILASACHCSRDRWFRDPNSSSLVFHCLEVSCWPSGHQKSATAFSLALSVCGWRFSCHCCWSRGRSCC